MIYIFPLTQLSCLSRLRPANAVIVKLSPLHCLWHTPLVQQLCELEYHIQSVADEQFHNLEVKLLTFSYYCCGMYYYTTSSFLHSHHQRKSTSILTTIFILGNRFILPTSIKGQGTDIRQWRGRGNNIPLFRLHR